MYSVTALRGPDSSDSHAYGINAAGDVAGLAFPTDGVSIWMVGAGWKNGTLAYSLPLQSDSLVSAVNGKQIAAGVRGFLNTPTQRAIAVQGGVMADLTAVGVGSRASGINDVGQICGWTFVQPRAWIVDQASDALVTWIDPLPGATRCDAYAINQIGEVAGRTDDDRGFFHASGLLVDLGAVAFVHDLNEAAVICGSVWKPFPKKFAPAIWDAAKAVPAMVELPIPPGFVGAHAQGINNKGDVVGTCWTTQSYNETQSAYICTGGVSTDLNMLISDPDWHLEFAEDINDAGEIAGTGYYKGAITAFLLSPIPVVSIPTGSLPELVGWLLGGPDIDAGGWHILPGGPKPVDPWGPFMHLNEGKRDALIALAIDEIAMYISDEATRTKVRTALLEGARDRLDHSLKQASDGRRPPVVRREVPFRRINIREGKILESLARYRR